MDLYTRNCRKLKKIAAEHLDSEETKTHLFVKIAFLLALFFFFLAYHYVCKKDYGCP